MKNLHSIRRGLRIGSGKAGNGTKATQGLWLLDVHCSYHCSCRATCMHRSTDCVCRFPCVTKIMLTSCDGVSL